VSEADVGPPPHQPIPQSWHGCLTFGPIGSDREEGEEDKQWRSHFVEIDSVGSGQTDPGAAFLPSGPVRSVRTTCRFQTPSFGPFNIAIPVKPTGKRP